MLVSGNVFLGSQDFSPGQGEQRFSKYRSKKPNLTGEIENNFHKNTNFASNKFSWLIWSKRNWTYMFWNYFIKNQLKLMFPKKCVFRSWKASNIWTLCYIAPNVHLVQQCRGLGDWGISSWVWQIMSSFNRHFNLKKTTTMCVWNFPKEAEMPHLWNTWFLIVVA